MKNYEQAFEDYAKGLKYKEIAEKFGVSLSTVKSWKSRHWNNMKVATKDGKVATLKPRESRNGSPPKGNQNAVTHGLFAKYLPEETQEIMNELSLSEPADIIWNNIMIQYTAIIRSQKIMFVNDQHDLSKETSGYSSGEGYSESYAVQYAWDKQANFLAAQSRAMATLSNLIRQFILIADEADERRLKLDSMRLSVDKTQAEIRRLSIQNGDVGPEEMPDDGFMDAIKNIANDDEVWNDDNIET